MERSPHERLRAGVGRRQQLHHVPTTRKRTRHGSYENLGQFLSLVGVVMIARKLTYGNSVVIPATAEIENTRRYREEQMAKLLTTQTFGTTARDFLYRIRIRS